MDATSSELDYKRVKEDLQLLREDLAKLTRSVSEGQKNNVSQLRDEILRESQEALDEVRGQGNAAYRKARQQGDEALTRAKNAGDKAIDNVEQRIGERPFLTLILAFLAGLVVGKLFDR